MSIKNIIRAWKDEDYRLSLSEAQRALLPEHPAGLIELSGAETGGVNGGDCRGGTVALPTTTVLPTNQVYCICGRGSNVSGPVRGNWPG